MLTIRQKELFDFIEKYIDTHSISPSFEEMKTALGLRSRSGIFRLLDEIEHKGYIRRYPLKSRAIEINQSMKESRIHESQEAFCNSVLRQIPFRGTLSFEEEASKLNTIEHYIGIPKKKIIQKFTVSRLSHKRQLRKTHEFNGWRPVIFRRIITTIL